MLFNLHRRSRRNRLISTGPLTCCDWWWRSGGCSTRRPSWKTPGSGWSKTPWHSSSPTWRTIEAGCSPRKIIQKRRKTIWKLLNHPKCYRVKIFTELQYLKKTLSCGTPNCEYIKPLYWELAFVQFPFFTNYKNLIGKTFHKSKWWRVYFCSCYPQLLAFHFQIMSRSS